MMVHPPTQRVVAVEPMWAPENNAVVTTCLTKAVRVYKNIDCYIMDRNCKYFPREQTNPNFKQIKTYAVAIVFV